MNNKQDPRYFKYSPFPKRQCAVTGLTDINGAAYFLSSSSNTIRLSASTTNPVVVTWANGFDPFPVDYAYKWTALVDGPSGWNSFSTGTHYLYIDYDPSTESVSYGSTTVAPNDDPVSPSYGAGVHWFNTANYKMYESVSSVWTERIRLFVGECVSNGSLVTSVITYAYNGRYVGPETAFPSLGVATSWNHYIGSSKITGKCVVICNTTEHGYSIGDLTEKFSESHSTGDYHGASVSYSRLSMATIRGASATQIINRTNGTSQTLTAANWGLIPKAERSY